jgi:hypothetical protein
VAAVAESSLYPEHIAHMANRVRESRKVTPQHFQKCLHLLLRPGKYYEVLMTVTMKNAVYWDIKPSSYLTGDTLNLCYTVQPVNAV